MHPTFDSVEFEGLTIIAAAHQQCALTAKLSLFREFNKLPPNKQKTLKTFPPPQLLRWLELRHLPHYVDASGYFNNYAIHPMNSLQPHFLLSIQRSFTQS